MLENRNEKFDLEFEIHFGNLKNDFKENYYLATQERPFENKVANCLMLVEKDKTKYAIIREEDFGVSMIKYINLQCFEDWHYKMKNIET